MPVRWIDDRCKAAAVALVLTLVENVRGLNKMAVDGCLEMDKLERL